VLEKLGNLQSLNLDLAKCKGMNNTTVGHLSKSLLKLSSLKDLSLYFPGCENLGDIGLGHLGGSLKII